MNTFFTSFDYLSLFVVLPQQYACNLLPVAGPCKGRMTRYYYNSASKQCQMFVYGGCQGNDNNFGSQEACERACSAGKIYHSKIC